MLESELIICLVMAISGGLTNVFYKHVSKIIQYILCIIVMGAVIYAGSTPIFSKDFFICVIIVFFLTPAFITQIDLFKKNK